MGNVDLDGIPLFAKLAPEDRERVASVARLLHWEIGHTALREGEFAFDLYAIVRGAVEVQHDGQRVRELGRGDFFGEIGVMRGGHAPTARRRSATVVVTAPTDAVAISSHEIRSLSEEIPALRDALELAAAERSQT